MRLLGIRIFAVMLLCMAVCGTVIGAEPPLKSLLQQADNLTARMQYDQAIELYRRVADSYDLSMPRADKELCLEGVFGLCDLNMQQGNYPEAFENLLLAENIIERDGLSDLRMHVFYGALFIIMTQQTVNAEYLHRSVYHDSIALPEALRQRDDKMIYRSFGDLILSHSYFGTLDRLTPYVKKIEAYSRTTDSWRPRASLHMFQYAKAMARKDYRNAAASYDSALTIVPDDAGNARTRASYYKTKALAETFGKDYPAALRSLEQAFSISYRYGLKDIRLAGLPILADIYRGQGREEDAWRAKVHMLELRDSLRSYVVAEDLHQLELKRERRDMQARMAVAEYRAKEKDWWLAGITVFALVILFFLLRLRNRNQRLRQHSALLYERMRQLYASQPIPVSDLKGEKRATAIDSDMPSTEADATDVEAKDAETKYEGSNLSEEDKKEIKAAILRVMETDALYSPELTLASFSKLVGRHPKAVSQVIHEEFGCNYSTYVNRARIVEVCRRVDMPQYAHLSMEAIGESVGFNSRTTFSVNFRRFTGLGIRAYRQEAQQHKNKGSGTAANA